MKKIDNTSGRRPQQDEEFTLTVEFRTGSRYAYHGDTKKEAVSNFKKRWGTFKGFVKMEWEIEKK